MKSDRFGLVDATCSQRVVPGWQHQQPLDTPVSCVLTALPGESVIPNSSGDSDVLKLGNHWFMLWIINQGLFVGLFSEHPVNLFNKCSIFVYIEHISRGDRKILKWGETHSDMIACLLVKAKEDILDGYFLISVDIPISKVLIW